MKTIVKTLALLFMVMLVPPGCVTNPKTGEKEPDWPKIADGFELAAKRLRDPALHDMARPLEGGDDIIEHLENAAVACDSVSTAVRAFVDAGGDEGGDVHTIVAAIKGVTTAASLLADLTDDVETKQKIAFAVFAVNSAVDFALLYLPEDPELEASAEALAAAA